MVGLRNTENQNLAQTFKRFPGGPKLGFRTVCLESFCGVVLFVKHATLESCALDNTTFQRHYIHILGSHASVGGF
jgi:hypothetical protein